MSRFSLSMILKPANSLSKFGLGPVIFTVGIIVALLIFSCLVDFEIDKLNAFGTFVGGTLSGLAFFLMYFGFIENRKAVRITEEISKRASVIQLYPLLYDELMTDAMEIYKLLLPKNEVPKCVYERIQFGEKQLYFAILIDRLIAGNHSDFIKKINEYENGKEIIENYCKKVDNFIKLAEEGAAVDISLMINTHYCGKLNSGFKQALDIMKRGESGDSMVDTIIIPGIALKKIVEGGDFQ